MTRTSRAPLILLAGLLLSSTGCGLLIGNVKPVDEKAESYGVADLSKENPNWAPLRPTQEIAEEAKAADTTATEVPDVAFQSRRTGSTIALNSACRSSEEGQPKDLHALSDLLFLGISDITLRAEKEMTVQRTPALETTIEGKSDGEPVKLRTLVLRRNACTYDLVYMARPDRFAENEADFDHFVASLRLK